MTVPISQKCLDALAKAATHITHFAATGVQHSTLDDAFRAAEILLRKEQIKKMEKSEKGMSVGIALMGEAKKILDTGKPIAGIIDPEINVLLKWFNKPNPTQGKVDKKRNHLKNLDNGKAAPFYLSWTEQ